MDHDYPSLHKIIKASSTASHQKLEQMMVNMLKRIQRGSDYAQLLGYMYNYFDQLEGRLMPWMTARILPDYEKRRKSALLKKDIIDLGLDVPRSNVVELPAISTSEAAMAALYVMEGSTLGGATIIKILEYKGIQSSTSFFRGYGMQTDEMWDMFLKALNNLVVDKEEIINMTTTVSKTFECFHNYLSLQNDISDLV